jgi:glycosyltransferase involved in cell wall biosynthesis
MTSTAVTGTAADQPHRRASDHITVGYLHLGRGESGVRRYGRILAEAAARRTDIDVIEADPGDRDAGLADLRRAARRLNAADVVQIQWKSPDWGGPYRALPRLEVFLAACRRPVVVTLHDVYPREGWRNRWANAGAIGLRRLSLGAAWVVVHSNEEAGRLKGVIPGSKLDVVPHFVEKRAPLPDRAAAKAALGLDGCRVISLVGFMTKRKGHRMVMEALRELPPDVMAIFVGAPIEGREVRGQELRHYAAQLGVEDRVRFTGYVSESELRQVMAATDVAVCPFRDMSASGSVSTWISTGRPIVSSDLPAFREYDALSRGSMRMFSPYTADALAAKLGATLEAGLGPIDPAVDRLRRRLATPRVVERYLDVYRVAAARS